ncbi:phasin family protein [Sulfurovum sp.]|jgi:polyhydroxyalkanoate synthesis regulator phasin|nr:phasin family protein [Sulfurovum sp.]
MERVTVDDLVKMGLGAMLVAKEKAESFIDEAMKQGDISKEEGEQFLANIKKQVDEKATEADKSMRKEIHEQLKSLGLATKEDIASLRHEITALKHEIQNLNKQD